LKTPVLGVLLLYYEPYAPMAMSRFNRFLLGLHQDARLLIVQNGAWPVHHAPAGCIQVVGNNTRREFSGWDAGIEFATAHDLIPDPAVVVFANDTFCIHNRFGPFSQRAFRKAFFTLIDAPETPALAGEAHGLAQPYRIDGLSAERWVSTHLFAMTVALLHRLGRLSPPTSTDRCYARSEGRLGFSSTLSSNLATHIEAWLLGSGRRRWEGAPAPAHRSLHQLRGKADSILAEKLLAARCVAAGARVVDGFESPALRALRRIEFVGQVLAEWVGRQPARVLHGSH
jgi:hypothetical protein